MKLLSWNVNGLRAAHDKGRFLPLLRDESPDVLLVQETKVAWDNLPDALREVPGYRARVHGARRKGYSGVAIYSKREPDEWFEGVGDPLFDDEARLLGARYDDVVVLSVYFPNSQAKGRRLDYRLRFGAALRECLERHRERGYSVALGGDYNVAHQEIDIARPKQNKENPGFLPEEREWMSAFLASGYVDTWRALNPEITGVYSWWSYRFSAREKNIGWRLDYFCVDEDLMPRVRDAGILTEVGGSDHCPVSLRLA